MNVFDTARALETVGIWDRSAGFSSLAFASSRLSCASCNNLNRSSERINDRNALDLPAVAHVFGIQFLAPERTRAAATVAASQSAPAAIFIDEFRAGGLQHATDGVIIDPGELGPASGEFGVADGRETPTAV